MFDKSILIAIKKLKANKENIRYLKLDVYNKKNDVLLDTIYIPTNLAKKNFKFVSKNILSRFSEQVNVLKCKKKIKFTYFVISHYNESIIDYKYS